jgi:ribonucleoside-diphosphate reductase beta chain
MASILEHDHLIYKLKHGFDFPIFHEYYERAVGSVWRHQEVAMESDLRDWQNATQEERDIIAGVLKGFVTSELGIGCYWSDDVCAIFPKPEVQAMARAFAFFETIHAAAYAYLNDVLGLMEYEAFATDPVALQKVEKFFEKLSPQVSLGVYSGAGEGVSLYSSFAILLSFNLTGRFKGLAQIISWSCRDEAIHSDSGSLLFKQLVKERGLSKYEREQIYKGFEDILDNEFAFIDSVFENKSLEKLNIEDMKAFLRVRANNRLQTLGLEPLELDLQTMKRARNISEWFYPMVEGASSNDFFAQLKDGANYTSKIDQDFSSTNLKLVNLNALGSLNVPVHQPV